MNYTGEISSEPTRFDISGASEWTKLLGNPELRNFDSIVISALGNYALREAVTEAPDQSPIPGIDDALCEALCQASGQDPLFETHGTIR